MRRVRAFLATLAALVGATIAQADCRQALALGLDVSGSVDAREYRLQLDGLAHALERSEVRAALLGMASAPVDLLIYEWSGSKDTAMILPWTTVRDDAVLLQITALLRSTERREANPGTALGIAMESGARFLDERAHCWKRTLDISGDGKSNLGTRPRAIKRQLESAGIVINGLVIGADAPSVADTRQTQVGELVAYFQANVILGPDAFVETALGYDDYADAMARKLLREIETLTLSDLDPQKLTARPEHRPVQ